MHPPSRAIRIAAGIIVFLGFFIVAAKSIDPDLFWHLRDGMIILATRAVPRFDAYSFTMPGFPWVDHEWLVEAGIAWLWSHGLWMLDVAAFAAAAGVPFFFWLRSVRSWTMIGCIMLVATVFVSFIGVRPQVLSYTIFFVVYALIAAYYSRDRGARKKRYLAALPLVFFAWANIHAEFLSGLALLGVFMAGDALTTFLKEKMFAWRELLFPLVILCASAAAALVNPYGINLYREIFTVMFSANTARYVVEWQPALTLMSVSSVTSIAAVLAIALFLAVALKMRRRLVEPIFLAGAAFLVLYMRSARMGPLFLITAIPVFAAGIAHMKREIEDSWRQAHFSAPARRTLAILGFFIAAAAVAIFVYGSTSLAKSVYPADAVNYLNRTAETGTHITIFNDYAWGGYLIENAPEIKVFVDGRMPHWIDHATGNSAVNDYIAVLGESVESNAWQAIFARRSVNTVLLRNYGFRPGTWEGVLAMKLVSVGWRVAYEDPLALVLEK